MPATKGDIDRARARLSAPQLVKAELARMHRYPSIAAYALAVAEGRDDGGKAAFRALERGRTRPRGGAGEPLARLTDPVRAGQRQLAFLLLLALELNTHATLALRELRPTFSAVTLGAEAAALRDGDDAARATFAPLARALRGRVRRLHAAAGLIERDCFGGAAVLWPRVRTDLDALLGAVEAVARVLGDREARGGAVAACAGEVVGDGGTSDAWDGFAGGAHGAGAEHDAARSASTGHSIDAGGREGADGGDDAGARRLASALVHLAESRAHAREGEPHAAARSAELALRLEVK